MTNRCKWSPGSSDSLLYVTYKKDQLNLFDVEKKVLIFTDQTINTKCKSIRLFIHGLHDFGCILQTSKVLNTVEERGDNIPIFLI